MSETTGPSDGGSDTRDELRTIAFRLREIQRLLGARVEQENRRLEAEGLDPVSDAAVIRQHEAREEGE